MIKYVIFDLDGVLIDSETLHQERMARFNEYFNLQLDNDLFKMLIGTNPKMNTMKRIYEKSSLAISYKEFERLLNEYDKIEPKNKLNYENSLFPSTIKILEYLKNKKYILALASSSKMEYIEDKLELFNLKEYFTVINSGEYLKESKPNPEIYQKTMKQLGAKKDDCAIVEDSFYGIIAAKKSCDFVIGKRDYRYPTNLEDVDYIIDDLIEIKNIL